MMEYDRERYGKPSASRRYGPQHSPGQRLLTTLALDNQHSYLAENLSTTRDTDLIPFFA